MHVFLLLGHCQILDVLSSRKDVSDVASEVLVLFDEAIDLCKQNSLDSLVFPKPLASLVLVYALVVLNEPLDHILSLVVLGMLLNQA